MTASRGAIGRLDDLTYLYPGRARAALEHVSMTVEPGLTIVAGASGSGKSSLLRVLNGLVPHFHGGTISGAAEVRGHDVFRTPTSRLAREVGFVFQDPEVQLVRSQVEDEVAFALENTGVPGSRIAGMVEASMEAAGITHLAGRVVTGLSGGERQRVAIASALALRPAVLALDEPTSQLDAEGAAAVLATCADLARAGTAVVVAEHRAGPALPLADRLAVTVEGHLEGPGPVRRMLDRLADPPVLQELGRRLGWDPAPLSVEEALLLRPALRRTATPPVSVAREPAWTLDGAALGRDGKAVLEDVRLFGGAGEVVVLMGPNGGGKTTLLRAIAGLGRPLSGNAWRYPGRVAYLPQDPAVLLHRRSVAEEVRYTLRRAGSEEPPSRVLEALGLAPLADAYPGDLSSGQRQRVAVGAILAGRPALALLDEPTRGLDGDSRRRLVDLLRDLAAAGAALVVATHDADLAAEIAGRVVFVGAGRAVDAGPPATALSGDSRFATDIGRLYPGGPVTVEGVIRCL